MSAVGNLRALDGLLAWVTRRKGGRDVVGQAIDALKTLFLRSLLPDRRLVAFEKRPFGALPSGREGGQVLLYWLMEDGIKKRCV